VGLEIEKEKNVFCTFSTDERLKKVDKNSHILALCAENTQVRQSFAGCGTESRE
jgi:hypothetical protein